MLEIDKGKTEHYLTEMFEELSEHILEEVVPKQIKDDDDGIGAEISAGEMYMRVFLPKELICVRVGEA